MRRSIAAWIPGSGEGRSPSPFRFAVRSGCLRQRLARAAYTNILDTTLMLVAARLKHVADSEWGSRRYLDASLLKE